MSLLRVHVSPSGRPTEELFIETPEALVGSAAHCDIRLPMEDAQPQHVRIRRAGNALVAMALVDAPLPRINGEEFSQAPLLPKDVLGIGTTQLRVTIVGAEAGQTPKQVRSGSLSPVTLVMIVLTMAASAAMLLLGPEKQAYSAPPATVPDLWSSESAKCPQSSPEESEAWAVERSSAADSKSERSPFHPEDGVAAVTLYELSAACFDAAQDIEAAREARARAARLRGRLIEDYRLHRVRLDHALSVQDWLRALDECHALGTFLSGNTSEYSTWLANLERMLSLKYGGGK